MKDDKDLKKIIKDNIDFELKNIKLSKEAKKEVLIKVNQKEKFINRILNYEIVIPVKPLVAIVTAICIGIGYLYYPIVKVDIGDIKDSKIEVVRLEEWR